MKILMTGATGFIGLALCKQLLANGHEVTAVVRPDSQRKYKIPDKVTVQELSFDNLDKISGQFDICYHLAWNGTSGHQRDDFIVQADNIKYTINMIKVSKKLGCRKFIGAGSQAEYGNVRKLCTEENVAKPFTMYGAAKLSAYHIGRITAAQENISFVWPRIYSIYGVGENDGTLINYLIDCFKKNITPELSCCENMWDYMYISDCVNALIMLGENEKTEGIYNVSSGEPMILKEYVNIVRKIISPDAYIDFGKIKTDIDHTFWLEPDVRRLKNIGFSTKVSFHEGIKKKLGLD